MTLTQKKREDLLLGKRNAFPKLFTCCKCGNTRKRKYMGAVRNLREITCKTCVAVPTQSAGR